MNSPVIVRKPGSYSEDFDFAYKNVSGKACHVIIDVTSHNPGGDTGAMTVTIQGVDPASGKKYTLLASASIVTTTQVILRVGPGLPVSSNVSANDVLPQDINIKIDHTNAHPMTYSVGLHIVS